MGRKTFFIDWVIIVPLFLLASLGLITINSTNPTLFSSQLVFIILGIGLFFLIQSIDYEVYSHFAPILYVLSCFLLLITFIGPEVRGSTRWLPLGSLRLQTSEFVKPMLLIAFSTFLSKYPPYKLSSFLIHVA